VTNICCWRSVHGLASRLRSNNMSSREKKQQEQRQRRQEQQQPNAEKVTSLEQHPFT